MELLPPEIGRTHAQHLLPVVALHGMVELHDAIKASFPHFQHISKTIDFKFPPNKLPRTLDSHDADIDSYLLRWKTLRKYCADIPSVHILIFDCPPERSWAGAEPLIVSFIATTREQRRKNCRIFVLLVDTNTSTASPLHSAFDDKLKSLRKHAELDENQVAYVSTSDLVPRSPVAAAVYKSVKELSQRYYTDMVKSLKKKQTSRHPVYNCRLQFKKGLASELCYDYQGAIKYYDRAFKMLQDIPSTGRLSEHKTFASFINFKLCALLMSSNAISNAKDQFRHFVQAYRDSFDHEIFKFQHLHFMAFQHKLFAQLLETSQSPSFISKRSINLPSSIAKIAPRDAAIGMSCHPGFYYQQAANLLSKRRAAYQAACSSASMTPPPAPAPNSSPSTFFADLINSGSNEGSESSGIVGLRRVVLDSGSGIPRVAITSGSIQVASEVFELLNKAIDQYQSAGARRAMFFLLACVAREQIELNMYEEAREVLNSCMSKFGQDGWLSLRSDCGHMLLQLSLATQDTVTMLQASLLLLHPDVILPRERKEQLQQAVIALLNGQPSMCLQPMQSTLSMHVDQHHRLLRCTCSWAKTTQIVEECGVLQLRVTSSCSIQPLAVSNLFVDMTPPSLSFSVSHDDSAHGVRCVEFKDGEAAGSAQTNLSIGTHDSGSDFQFSVCVNSVGVVYPNSFTFTIGSAPHSLQLTYVVPDRCIRYSSNLLTAPVSSLKADVLLAASIPDLKDNSPCLRVAQHPPALTIAAYAPSSLLVGEQSLVTFVMSTNGEQVRDVSMTLVCEAPSQRRSSDAEKSAVSAGNGLRVMRDVSQDSAATGPQLVTVDADHVFALPNAETDSVFCQSVTVVAAAVGKQSLVASVTYTNERNMIKTAFTSFVFVCHSPFAVSASVAATNPVQMATSAAAAQAATVILNTAVMLGVTLTVASPDSIIINNACLSPNSAILTAPHLNASAASDSLSPLHSVDDQIAAKDCDVVVPFLVAFRSYSSASCGTLRLVWQRAQSPLMHLIPSSDEASPARPLTVPPNAPPLPDGTVIPSSAWLKSHSPRAMAASPVNFRAPLPCPACYSSTFSIDLLLPSKVVVGVPADMAFVVTSCSDFLEDVEVEVEQLSPNFIIAGYFKTTMNLQPRSSASFLLKVIPRTAGLLSVPVVHFRSLKGLPPSPQTRRDLTQRGAAFVFVSP